MRWTLPLVALGFSAAASTPSEAPKAPPAASTLSAALLWTHDGGFERFSRNFPAFLDSLKKG